MNITITIENPSAAVLKALGKAVPDNTSLIDALKDLVSHTDTTGHDEPVMNELDFNIGDSVHWAGARFNFDGIIERVDQDAVNSGDDNDKVVYVRRGDTNKLVSLTNADIDTGGLTHI